VRVTAGAVRSRPIRRSTRLQTGKSAARRCKTVLNGIMGLAAIHEAIDHNPVRDTSAITVASQDAEALTLQQVREIRLGVRADEKAVDRDVPALVDFLLGTGLRIGEMLAVTWDALDLAAGTVEIRGTVVRQKGVGLIIQPKPKTKKGWRKLHLPGWLVASSGLGNRWRTSGTSPSRRSGGSCATSRTPTRTSATRSTRSATTGSPATRSGRPPRRCWTRAA
jgi:integrase